MRLDANRPLASLHDEWENCTKCELGQRRQLLEGAFVRGEGAHRGVMVIGEGPGKNEENQSKPFVGRSGKLLRRMLQQLQVEDVCYFANIVACRSCKQETDANGQPMFRNVRGVSIPKYRDQPPTQPQIDACLPRLYEEIYIVDPLVVVALGATTATTLLRRQVSILREAGREEHMLVPGLSQVPVFTEKKGVWIRANKGKLIAPTERSSVRYLCIPTLHPSFVVRASADRSEGSPMRKLFSHLKTAAAVYVKMAEYYNINTPIDLRTNANVEDVWEDTEETDDD